MTKCSYLCLSRKNSGIRFPVEIIGKGRFIFLQAHKRLLHEIAQFQQLSSPIRFQIRSNWIGTNCLSFGTQEVHKFIY